MWATQTFGNIAQLTTWAELWNWGFPSDHTLPLQSCRFHLKWQRSALLGEYGPYWGQASSRKQFWCGSHGLSNILKLQARFLYSIYHERAGKSTLFHMRGDWYHAFNTWCTLKESNYKHGCPETYWKLSWRPLPFGILGQHVGGHLVVGPGTAPRS